MSNWSQRLRRCLAVTAAGALASTLMYSAAIAESDSSPEPATASSSAPASESASQPEPAPASPSDAPPSETPSSESTQSPPPAGSAPDQAPTVPGKPADETQQATPSAPDTSITAESAAPAATAADPTGSMGAWAGGDGLIYFSGYAYDHDDLGATAITMYTLNGTVVGYQPAQLRSADLDAYGLPYKGVFGAFQAPSAGSHQLCMFVFNIGGGADKLASCVNVNVPAKNPRGDIVVDVIGSQIRVNGWLFDESNPTQSLAMWVVDNGVLVQSFVANAPSPYLYSYGVGGSHAFGTQYTPAHSGSHNICVYGINVGFGVSTWIECGAVVVDITADNPKGELLLEVSDYEDNGFNDLWAEGWAYDPNNPYAAIDVAIMLDGQLVEGDTADGYSRHLTPPGVPGDHGFYFWLGEVGWELTPGWHTVCLYAYNIGPGTGQWIQCSDIYA